MELMDILAKAELAIGTGYTLSASEVDWTGIGWDETALDRGSALSVDIDNNSITVNEDGPYSVMIMLNAAFDRQEEVSLGFSINGASPVRWLQEQGRGASKPIDFSWYGIHTLSAGDVIQAVMKLETAAGDVNILSGTFTVAKEF